MEQSNIRKKINTSMFLLPGSMGISLWCLSKAEQMATEFYWEDYFKRTEGHLKSQSKHEQVLRGFFSNKKYRAGLLCGVGVTVALYGLYEYIRILRDIKDYKTLNKQLVKQKST
jgi:hypothetical protein